MPSLRLLIVACAASFAVLAHAMPATASPYGKKSSPVFDEGQVILFEDDFSSGKLSKKWRLAINDQNNHHVPGLETKDRLEVVPAPGMPKGAKAFRAVVPRALGSFRSELALSSEDGFQERWYAARVQVSKDWVFDTNAGNDIVLQWHAVMGKERVGRDFPPLSISVKNDSWKISRAFGAPADIQTDTKTLEEKVEKGKWVDWVLHVKWSSGEDGFLEIWKDGKAVWEVKGPNTYLMRAHTPYFKTGIYHPTWKVKDKEGFDREALIIPSKTVYITDIKVGSVRADYRIMAPPL